MGLALGSMICVIYIREELLLHREPSKTRKEKMMLLYLFATKLVKGTGYHFLCK